jgi:hypothetical protein
MVKKPLKNLPFITYFQVQYYRSQTTSVGGVIIYTIKQWIDAAAG